MKNINKEWLNKHRVCPEGIQWVLKQRLRDPIKLIRYSIKKQYKLGWANWFIVRIMTQKQYVSYAVYAVEQVIDIFEKEYPNDKRPRKAIYAAKKWIKSPTEKNAVNAANAANASNAAYVALAAANAANAVNAAALAAYAAHAANAANAVNAANAAALAAYAANAALSAALAAYAANAATDATDAAYAEMRTKILKYGLKLLGA